LRIRIRIQISDPDLGGLHAGRLLAALHQLPAREALHQEVLHDGGQAEAGDFSYIDDTLLYVAGLRIRIHLISIRILMQHFRLPIRIRIQGFDDQKIEKKMYS
jgi:hypothetical protein